MTNKEFDRCLGELFDLRDCLREMGERELGSDPEIIGLHLSALRTVPDRIDKAVADYIKTSALPVQLKPQDLLDLFRRSQAAISLVGFAAALQHGETLEEPTLSAARYVLSELLKVVEHGSRASVLRWLVIDLCNHIPDPIFDAVMTVYLDNFWSRPGHSRD